MAHFTVRGARGAVQFECMGVAAVVVGRGGRGIVCRHCGEDQCVFALIHEAANALQLCKDLTCL